MGLIRRFIKNPRRLLPLLLALLCFAQVGGVWAIQIDKFEGGQGVSVHGMGNAQSSVISVASALGGTRSIVSTSQQSGMVFAGVIGGLFYQNEGSGAQAITFITWDGDLAAGLSSYNGLGGLDLTADGASNFTMTATFDYPSAPLDLLLRVYDVSDPTEQRFSDFLYTLDHNMSEVQISLPFNQFAAGPAGAADLRHVGAIVLRVAGRNAANDLTLRLFGTDGRCSTLVPLNGNVVDLCGVCGGDSSSCKDCRGVPNGTATYDLCGVCAGDNSSCKDCRGEPNGSSKLDACGVCGGDDSLCKDCNGVPNGATKLDVCGLCGGDSSSCRDCSGVPNGPAKLDVCSVCGGANACVDCAGTPFGTAKIDCCGVCEGDGSTCLNKCKIYDIKTTKGTAQRAMQSLYASVVKYSKQELLCSSGTHLRAKTRIAKAKNILKANTTIFSTFIADKIKLCDTIYCTKTSLTSFLKSLQRNTTVLYQLSREAQYGAGGVCEASPYQGSSPQRTSQSDYNKAQNSIKKMPVKACN